MGTAKFYDRYIFNKGETQLEIMNYVQRQLKLWLCQYDEYEFREVHIQFNTDTFGNQLVKVEIVIDYR